MQNTEQRRAFLIQVLYITVWTALIYLFLKYGLPLVMPFVIAFGIAFALQPLIAFVSKKTKLGRGPAAVILLTLLYLLVAAVLILLGSRLIIFISNWLAGLPTYYQNTMLPALTTVGDSFKGFMLTLDPAVLEFLDSANASIIGAVTDLVKNVSSGAVGILTGTAARVPAFMASFVLTIISSFFFVVDFQKIIAFAKKQMSEKAVKRLSSVRYFLVNVLFKFVRAYLLIILITACELTVGLLILQVNAAPLVALGIALLDIFPVVGSGTILLPWALYSLLQGDIFRTVGLLVLYVVITIIRQVIEPRIVGKQIGLYPLLTLISMFVGARLFGFWGMLGLPVALTVLVHLNISGEISWFKK